MTANRANSLFSDFSFLLDGEVGLLEMLNLNFLLGRLQKL